MGNDLSAKNADFWNELCGTSLAQHLGIMDHSGESLTKFDEAYMSIYPYLLKRVSLGDLTKKKILEVGLGYGTLGQKIASVANEYTGLDIAEKPVWMMNHRLQMHGLEGRAIKGSVLNCPFEDNYFDSVVAIGCYHHTGDVQRCIDETYRVLKPNGRAYIMVYNQYSLRQWQRWPKQTFKYLLSEWGFNKEKVVLEAQRHNYDSNSKNIAAPETTFHSKSQLRSMFRRFSNVKLYRENFDNYRIFKLNIPREKLLSTWAKLFGLDIYIIAQK